MSNTRGWRFPYCTLLVFPTNLGFDLLAHGRVAADVGMAGGLRQQFPHRVLLLGDQVLHVGLQNRRRQLAWQTFIINELEFVGVLRGGVVAM